jgi:hypothetical protein
MRHLTSRFAPTPARACLAAALALGLTACGSGSGMAGSIRVVP